MSTYQLTHHQVISSALKIFNSEFLANNNIIFGGGTRIALELNEYRESVDIDFLCPNKESYRAVREQISNISLGKLVTKDFVYLRDIRSDRYAVRTIIEHEGVSIKLEFISCDNYDLRWCSNNAMFPVPFLDRTSCYYTKLLANSDRRIEPPHKDIFDLLAMRAEWGVIPDDALSLAIAHYGREAVIGSLVASLEDIQVHRNKYVEHAVDLTISSDYAAMLFDQYASLLLSQAKKES